jgi:hypothetical protein
MRTVTLCLLCYQIWNICNAYCYVMSPVTYYPIWSIRNTYCYVIFPILPNLEYTYCVMLRYVSHITQFGVFVIACSWCGISLCFLFHCHGRESQNMSEAGGVSLKKMTRETCWTLRGQGIDMWTRQLMGLGQTLITERVEDWIYM